MPTAHQIALNEKEYVEEPFLRQLERLLAVLPSSARVVLSSRRDPPIRLHRLRLGQSQQLAQVGIDLLADIAVVFEELFGVLATLPDALAMTAGLWSLSRLTNSLYRQLAELGATLAEGLADAARRAGVAVQVNAIGSMLTPFFTSSGPVRNYQSALRSDTARYGAFFRAMIARGIYPPPSQYEAWFLSGAHTKRDVEKTLKAAREAMKEIR